VDVEELRKFEAEANKTNLGAIQGAHHDENYVVLDPANRKIQVYSPDNKLLWESSEISTGVSGDDYNTVTYTGGGKGLENFKGNNSTPAGITRISSITEYHGAPAFQRARLTSNGEIRMVHTPWMHAP
jgi:murein tripeptide amidase MpaA